MENLQAKLEIDSIKTGDLVEVTLTANAELTEDTMTASQFFMPEEGVNEPDRKLAGYIAQIIEHQIVLLYGWDKNTRSGRRSLGLGGVTIYEDAIKSYRKL